MAVWTVISGEVLAAPTYKETNNMLAASFRIKSRRYDFERKKNVEDPYTVFAYGKQASYLRENAVGEKSYLVLQADCRVDDNGLVVFEARHIALAPEDGFEFHVIAGAVEKGRHSIFSKKDNTEGDVVNASVRVPWHSADGEEYNRMVRIAAWDGRARGISKACTLDEESDHDRRWIVVHGKPRTEKYETDTGETRISVKTTIDAMEITPITSLKHVFERSAEVGNEALAPSLDGWNPPSPAKMEDDDDIPF